MIPPWSAQAFNPVPNAKNQIHGEQLAKQYGFSGALVPGVTISAYLIHPAVEAWGQRWLSAGAADVRVGSPLYDLEAFNVRITKSNESGYSAELVRDGDIVSASAIVSLPETVKPPPNRRGDPIANPDHVGAAASVERWTDLQRQGCQAYRYCWPGDSAMSTYLRDESQMPELLQHGKGGYANMSFVLGCSNFILESNAYMNPWVHLETHSQNYRAISAGTTIIAEMAIDDFYQKKGHEFVDVNVSLFDEQDDACLTTIQLRAIYKLRTLTA